MGGTRSGKLCDLVLQMWNWCIQKQLTVYSEHLLGRLNANANYEPRHRSNGSNWRRFLLQVTSTEHLVRIKWSILAREA